MLVDMDEPEDDPELVAEDAVTPGVEAVVAEYRLAVDAPPE